MRNQYFDFIGYLNEILFWKEEFLIRHSYHDNPGPRINSISIHGFLKIHGYPYGYSWFLDVSLQLSMQVWISSLISNPGNPCKDILRWISVKNKCPWMDIHVWISVFNYPCFQWYPCGNPLISMDVHAWTCYGFSIQDQTRPLLELSHYLF